MKFRTDLAQARLKELLHYDPETGVFTRARANGTAKIGDIAGTQQPGGYRAISVDGRLYQSNRLAWLYMTGSWPKALVDHRDLDPSNDRWDNLRAATASQNQANCPAPRNNCSGAKGVHWNRAMRRWCAQLIVARRVVHASYHHTVPEAAAAYAAAARKHFGEFAFTEVVE